VQENDRTSPATHEAAAEGITPAFRKAWRRLNARPLVLCLIVCGLTYFQRPLEAIMLAGLCVVFGAMAAAISMVASHWRALTLKPPMVWAGIAQLWGTGIAWLVIHPAALAFGGLAAGDWSTEPSIWLYALIPAAFWATAAVRALVVAHGATPSSTEGRDAQ